MQNKKTSITVMQYIFIIQGIQIGPGILSLPKVIAEKAGPDGWISIFIGGIISMLASILFILVAKTIPHDSPSTLLNKLFGKYVGGGIRYIYILYFSLYYWIVLVKSMLFTKNWFLSNTPDYVIIFLFCVPTYVLLKKGLQIVGRYCELMFFMTMWLPFILLLPLSEGNWLHFLPILKDGFTPILEAVPTLIYSYLGFEICFFLYPFLQQKKYAIHGVVIANLITMSVYTLVTIICFYTFSPNSITQFTQPILNLLKLIEFRFLERFDMIWLSIYLLVVSTSWIAFLQGVLLLIKGADTKKNFLLLGLLLTGGIAVIVISPSWQQSEGYQNIISHIGFIVAYIFPFVLWLYSKFFYKYIRR